MMIIKNGKSDFKWEEVTRNTMILTWDTCKEEGSTVLQLEIIISHDLIKKFRSSPSS